MDLIVSLRVLRRHWLITTFLLLVTLAGTGATVFVLPWSYQAQSTMVLLPSRAASQVNGFNPYLSFDSSVTNTAFLLAVVVTGPTSKQGLVAAGHTGTYTVGLSPNTAGPVLIATATAPTKSQAEGTIKAVTAAIGAYLQQLQVSKGILPKNQIGIETASMTSQATKLISKKAKVVVLALVLGLFATFGVPLMVDASAARRRQEREEAQRLDEDRRMEEERQFEEAQLREEAEAEEFASHPAGGPSATGRARPEGKDAPRPASGESEYAGARRPRQWTD